MGIELSLRRVSSNWERAIEAYYQLKGGQVDYGKGHAKKYNIEIISVDQTFNNINKYRIFIF